MANTFFTAKGLAMGDSLVEADALETAKELLALGGDQTASAGGHGAGG